MTTDPRRLAYLLAVYRSGGIQAAGELMGVTPSAVSQQISRLEAEEGMAVLDRGPRGVSLTPAGRVLVEAAERIEAELVGAQQAIAALGDGVTGNVRIGAFQTAIRAIVCPCFPRLAERYPALALEILEHDPAEALRLLRSGDLDLVLLERDAQVQVNAPRGTAEHPLLDEPWRLVIPAGAPVPQRLGDLADLTFVSGAPGTAADRALARLARTLGADIATRHSTFDFDTALALVAAGQGVALLPALAVPMMAKGTTFQVVRLAGLGTRRIYARHRKTRREPTPAVRVVVDVMLELASEIHLD